MGVAQPVLVCAVFLGLLTSTPATSPPEENGQPMMNVQEILTFLDYLQNKGINSDGALKEHVFRNFQDQPADASDLDELRSNEIGNELDAASLNKRASYMALCHFKICNMGRKRGFFRKSNHNLIRRW
ncbi:Hypothetical protein NTJ_09400 [Nesidiocoris tenuis]|uniref:Uncharacterized protein n=1 Tax=Nesidiocoris tenuis TaxID=355587 RepID=A0ABN7AX49_9HEMI|nr:Hypothetical protein NTJ_09400 [Nesidiocoris tenuis]